MGRYPSRGIVGHDYEFLRPGAIIGSGFFLSINAIHAAARLGGPTSSFQILSPTGIEILGSIEGSWLHSPTPEAEFASKIQEVQEE